MEPFGKSIHDLKVEADDNEGFSSRTCAENSGTTLEKKMTPTKKEVGRISSVPEGNYGIPPIPSSTLAFTSVGDDGQYYIIETSHQFEGAGEQNITCSIDPSTGNLMLHHHQGSRDRNDEENVGVAVATTSTTTLSTLGDPEFDYHRNNESLTLSELGHDYSQYSVSGEEEPYNYQSMTLSSEIAEEYQQQQQEEEEDDGLSGIRVSNVTSVADMKVGSNPYANINQLKVVLWSNRKTIDLLQCMNNHEHKFRNASKTRTHIWNEISKDMAGLGHTDCNRDECNKKWSNLYRTWKKVKLRPRETRRKWQHYDRVSELSKSLAVRNREKVVPSKKSSSKSSKDLIAKLLKNNIAYQEAVEHAEEKFKKQTEELNFERDNILKDIKQVLEFANPNSTISNRIENQLGNIMNLRTVGTHTCEGTESRQESTEEASSKSSASAGAPIYFLRIPKDFVSYNPQYQLLQIDSSSATNGEIMGNNNDTFQLCVSSVNSQVSDGSGF